MPPIESNIAAPITLGTTSTEDTLVSLVSSRAFIPEEATLREALVLLRRENASSLPVLRAGRLVGQVRSARLLSVCIEGTAAGASPIRAFVDHDMCLLDDALPPSEVWGRVCRGELVLNGDPLFVVDDAQRYVGMVRIEDLLRRAHERDQTFARYANPLTGLPGSVPIDARIDELLAAGRLFVVACCDVEGMRTYNEAFGYARGDEVIRFVADVIARCLDPDLDFAGHVSGDDFIVISQSPDWFERCERMSRQCSLGAPDFYPRDSRAAGGLYVRDRAQRRVFHPFFALSIGAVSVEPGRFQSHHDVLSAGVAARQRAKLARGGAICVDDRAHAANGEHGIAKLYN